MARAGQARSRGAHLADRVALGVLTSVFPRPAVAAAVDAAGARGQRSRVLTAELTAYYTLGCALWQQESHEEVWEQLTGGVPLQNSAWIVTCGLATGCMRQDRGSTAGKRQPAHLAISAE